MNLAERRVVLVDRHPAWLEALAAHLQEWGVDVMAAMTDVDAAIAAVMEHQPDMLVVGTSSTDMVDILRHVRRAALSVKLIVLADDSRPEAVGAAFEAGATAYVLKTALADDIATALRQSFERQLFFAHQRRPGSHWTPPKPLEDPLTERELEILRLVAEGKSNTAIARNLWVVEQTVKFHLSNIFRKLNVSNRTEAARWAHRHGVLVESSDPEVENEWP